MNVNIFFHLSTAMNTHNIPFLNCSINKKKDKYPTLNNKDENNIKKKTIKLARREASTEKKQCTRHFINPI